MPEPLKEVLPEELTGATPIAPPTVVSSGPDGWHLRAHAPHPQPPIDLKVSVVGREGHWELSVEANGREFHRAGGWPDRATAQMHCREALDRARRHLEQNWKKYVAFSSG